MNRYFCVSDINFSSSHVALLENDCLQLCIDVVHLRGAKSLTTLGHVITIPYRDGIIEISRPLICYQPMRAGGYFLLLYYYSAAIS